MKTCTKCNETKPLTGFYKEAKARDGLKSQCKSCINASNAKYQTDNPDKCNTYKVKWKLSNPHKVKAGNAKYYIDNKDKCDAANAKWRSDNHKKHKASIAKWWEGNPKARRIYKHNRRARSVGKLSKGLADKLFKLQRGKCACGCKKLLGDNFHIDHIMPLALGGTNTDNNIQLLRSTCNNQKSAKHPIDFMQSRGFLL